MNIPKTLRQLAGLAKPTAVLRTTTALVLIDIQRDYFGDKLIIPAGEAAVQKAAELLAWARRNRLMVVHVQHQMPRADSPMFTPGTNGIEFHPAVTPTDGERIVVKHFPSSFTQTELNDRLKERGIETLVLCGLMTHLCVDTTARSALEHGYRTIIARDACATRDLPNPEGNGVIPHAAIHAATLAALADRFADVMTTAEITSLTME